MFVQTITYEDLYTYMNICQPIVGIISYLGSLNLTPPITSEELKLKTKTNNRGKGEIILTWTDRQET